MTDLDVFWRERGARELQTLLREWDPIGVFGAESEWSENEYDAYLWPVWSALRDGGGEAGVRKELKAALDHMGLPYRRLRERRWSKRITRWYASAAKE